MASLLTNGTSIRRGQQASNFLEPITAPNPERAAALRGRS